MSVMPGMPGGIKTCVAIALAWAGMGNALAAQTAPPTASPHRALLDRYCVTCHNEKLKTAGLTLDKLNLENTGEAAPMWEKVVRKLRTGAMPPAKMPRPEKAAADSGRPGALPLNRRWRRKAAEGIGPQRVPPPRQAR